MQTSRPKKQKVPDLVDTIIMPKTQPLAYGVILDATGHYKTNESIDYVTRLRVIDHTLNAANKYLTSDITPFVYVFIYSQTVSTSPQIGRIGDVIRLQNFHFSSFENSPKAVFRLKQSSWDIFDGRKNANDLPVMSSHNERAGLPEYEKKKLHKLRIWAELFFMKKSLYKMNWFKRQIPKMKKKTDIWEMKDVDIIAKLLADISVKKNKQFYQRLVFVDKEKNIFLAELKGLLTGIDRGDVLKLRSIGILFSNGQYKITFSSYSNFMVLQKYFKDAKDLIRYTKDISYDQKKLKTDFLKELHLSSRSKEMIGPNTFIYTTRNKQSDVLNSKNNLEVIFPILKNFSYDVAKMGELTSARISRKRESKFSSAILAKHAKLKVFPLDKLLSYMKKVNSNKKKSDYFRVQTTIESVENVDFDSNFKIFSPSKNKTWSINRENLNKIPDDAKVIFYNVFGLKDESLEENDNVVHGYLITYNENPKYIFDLWRLLPDPLVVKDWLGLEQSRKDKFTNCLQKLIDPKKKFDLILQIVEAEGGRVYLKIVDSIFWIIRQKSR